MDDTPIYRFGVFELNARTRQLLRRGRLVAIQPRPFELLLYLIRHRDRPVPREELLAEVWRGVHVDDEAVRFTLHVARKAVDDDGSRQAVIRTVPRVGSRFVAEVEEVRTARSGLAAESTEAARREVARSPFLGRDELIAEAGALLEEAAGGRSRVLLLSGEAGIGKTRALERLSELAESRGARVFRGRCVESEGAPAFWPWVQILRAAVGANPSPALLGALGTGAREVAWMVPELRQFTPDLPQAPSMDARAARFLLFDSVVTLFKTLTAEVTHLISIDDLHRADGASAALFQHLARELGESGAGRLLLVGTYREGELRVTSGNEEAILSVATLPHSRHALLAGLEVDDVKTLVHALSGCVPGEAALTSLCEKTNGNPFFLNQIVSVLRSEGRLTDLEGTASLALELPPHVQDAIRRQLRFLPDSTRELIELGAVIGIDFTVGELESAADLDRARVLSLLGVAIDANVIQRRTGESGRFRFVHALVRDSLYAGIPMSERANTHARVARVLEQKGGSHPSDDSASIAHHYAHSSARGDVSKAIHFYEFAARWSNSSGAFAAAPGYLDEALALLDGTDQNAQVWRCHLLLQLGDALTDSGLRERAREALQVAASLARRENLRTEMATAALRFAPDLLAIETGVYDPQLIRILEDALACLGQTADALRARLLARLAIALQWNPSEDARAESLCNEAVTVASQVEDQDTKQYSQLVKSLLTHSIAHPERVLSPSLHESWISPPLEILHRILRMTSLMLMSHVDELDAEIRGFAELVERSRHPQARWYVGLMHSTRALMEGRFRDHEQVASQYLALGEKYGDRNAMQSYAVQRLLTSFDFGGVDVHESQVREIVAAFPMMAGWRAGLALTLAELERIEEARSEMHRVVAAQALERSRANEWYGTFGGLALACGVVGEPEIAARLYEQLLAHEDQLIVIGYCSHCLGSTQRLLGNSASAMGRWDLAASHFEAALRRNAEIGARAINARVYFEMARMLKKAGRPIDARRSARRATEIASEFGMSRLAAKCRSLMRSRQS